jgi:hypothetical protein
VVVDDNVLRTVGSIVQYLLRMGFRSIKASTISRQTENDHRGITIDQKNQPLIVYNLTPQDRHISVGPRIRKALYCYSRIQLFAAEPPL